MMLPVIYLLATFAAVRQAAGVEIGELPTEQHQVSGTLHVTDSRTLSFADFNYDGQGPVEVCIADFNYDGGGSGAFLYYYAPGQAVDRRGGGVIIPLPSSVGQSDGSFQRRRYTNEDFTVTLPAGTDVCDIGTLTVWCRPFQAIFTRIVIPRTIFVNSGADPCTLASATTPPPTTPPPTTPPPTTSPPTTPPPTTPPPPTTSTSTTSSSTAMPTTVAVPQSIEIGQLPTEQHQVSGILHVTDSRTLSFADFNYDGQGPDAFLYYYAPGQTVDRQGGGVIIPLPSSVGESDGSFQSRRYTNEDFTVTLPDGTDVCDIGTLTVWCRPFQAIFTRIMIPRTIFVNSGADPCTLASATTPPATSLSPSTSSPTTSTATTIPPTTSSSTVVPTAVSQSIEIGQLPTEQHQVSGILHVTDSRTLSFVDFNYDGQGPDAFLYYYAPGQTVDRHGGGVIIPLPSSVGESDGSFQRRRFTNEDFTVTLPDGTDICSIGTLTIWCRPFQAIFTRIEIPRNIFLNNGADPCTLAVGATVTLPPLEFDNCIALHETLQLSWKVDTDNSQVGFKMCGCQSLDPSTNQYMGFGLSGSTDSTLMLGADPTIAWVDSATSQPHAVDYHLSAYTQCRAGVGACPDTLDSSGTCTNDVTVVSGSVMNGKQCVSFTRRFSTSDSACDLSIDPANLQYTVWATGGLGVTAFKHFIRAERDTPIHLGRIPQDQCASTQLVCRGCQTFVNERIIARSDATFTAQIGPSGNERGYMGITGRPGWGIAWYINDTLIPELIVERGQTYTFIIKGGTNPNDLSNYHPLYITDSIGGGRIENTIEQRNNETVYAGFDGNGDAVGVGHLCQLMETATSEIVRQSCHDLQRYITSLEQGSSCNSGDPGKLVWTPDENTPSVVYYQCATHLNLGWRITVLNKGDPVPPRELFIAEAPTFVASLWMVLLVAIAAFFGCY